MTRNEIKLALQKRQVFWAKNLDEIYAQPVYGQEKYYRKKSSFFSAVVREISERQAITLIAEALRAGVEKKPNH